MAHFNRFVEKNYIAETFNIHQFHYNRTEDYQSKRTKAYTVPLVSNTHCNVTITLPVRNLFYSNFFNPSFWYKFYLSGVLTSVLLNLLISMNNSIHCPHQPIFRFLLIRFLKTVNFAMKLFGIVETAVTQWENRR